LAEVEEDEAAAGRALGAAEEADRAGAGAERPRAILKCFSSVGASLDNLAANVI